MVRRLWVWALAVALVAVPVAGAQAAPVDDAAAGSASPAVASSVSAVEALAEPVVSTVLTPRVFVDVSEEISFAKEMTWLANAGISRGWDTAAGAEYRPYRSITRDAMAAFLFRVAAPQGYVAPEVSPFVDVTASNTQFYREICWLAESGISTGWVTPAGREFRPFLSITRDAMAAFLFRLGQLEGDGPLAAVPAVSSFTDVPASSEFVAQIEWLAQSGISTGWVTSAGAQFRPYAPITRDAMAAFLFRFAAVVVPEIPAQDGVVVAPELTILEDADLAGAVVEAGTLVLPASSLLAVFPNDVLVAGLTDATPEGLLARVTTVTFMSDGTRVIGLGEATLVDAIARTDGPVEVAPVVESSTVETEDFVTLEEQTVARTLPALRWETGATILDARLKVAFSRLASGTVTSGYDHKVVTRGGFAADVEARVKVTGAMVVDIGWFRLNEAGLEFEETVEYSAEAGIKLEDALETEKRLATFSQVLTFPVGPVPVMVQISELARLKTSASAGASVAITSATTATSSFGFTYTHDDGFEADWPIPSIDDTEFALEGTVDLSARVAVMVTATVKTYGIVGVTAGIGPYASTALHVGLATGPDLIYTCPSEIGIHGEVGFVAGIDIWGFATDEWKLTVGGDKVLHEQDFCAGGEPTEPFPDVLAFDSLDIPDAYAGAEWNMLLKASGGTPPYEWSVVGAPSWMTLWEWGQLSGTPESPGTAFVTVVVTDAAGATDSMPLSVPVWGDGDGGSGGDEPLALDLSLPTFAPGEAISVQLEASGGTAPYAFAGTGLPDGLTLSVDGLLEGSVAIEGDHAFDVTVTDADDSSLTVGVTIRVREPAPRIRSLTPLANPDWAGGHSWYVDMNTSGDKVVFSTTSLGLSSERPVANSNVYVRDTSADVSTVVTEVPAGGDVNFFPEYPTVSDDGGRVAFMGYGEDFFAVDGGTARPSRRTDIIVRDLAGSRYLNASAAAGGGLANAQSRTPSMDASGRYVAFVSDATDLIADIDDTNNNGDVFLRDLDTGELTLVTRGADGNPTPSGAYPVARIAPDASSVLYYACSDGQIPGMELWECGYLVYDVAAGTTAELALTVDGLSAVEPEWSDYPNSVSISDDGRLVVVMASYTDSSGTAYRAGAFVHDLEMGTTVLARRGVPADGTGAELVGRVASFDISGDGALLAVTELAQTGSITIGRRTYAWLDVALYDLETGERTLVRDSVGGVSPRAVSEVRVNVDGTRVVFAEVFGDPTSHRQTDVMEWSAPLTF